MMESMEFVGVAAANVEMIRRVAIRLGSDIRSRVMFVGGAATALLLTDPAAPEVRPTDDVDIVVELLRNVEYEGFSALLRERGFREDVEGDPPVLCRWKMDDLTVDIMPDDESVLGFTNPWYGGAFQTSRLILLPSGQGDDTDASDSGVAIRLISAPYFLATKLEAFFGRGKGDFYVSHDMEDIVTIIDGRAEIVTEFNAENMSDVRNYVAEAFAGFLADDGFREAVEGHLSEQNRLSLVLDRFTKISQATNT